MSYHEVSVEKRYIATCEDCGETFDFFSSAGGAEEWAIDHIKDDQDNHFNHVVTITEVTKVGRQI